MKFEIYYKKIEIIIKRLKEITGYKNDLDIAHEIGLSQSGLSTAKGRDTVPWKKIFAYCDKNKISYSDIIIASPNSDTDFANGKSDIDKPQDVNVSLSESKNTTREGIMSGERLDRYIQMLEDRVDALEAENAALREKKRDVR